MLEISDRPRIAQVREAGLRRFLHCQTGAVTVDWTVLAAAAVGFGLAAVLSVRSGVVDLGIDIHDSLAGAQVAGLSAGWPNAGITNGICPGENALRQSHAALVAAGETFEDFVTGNATGEWNLTVWNDWLRMAESTGFSADEFVGSYEMWQSNSGPGTAASREFHARFFACTIEADPRDWSQEPGGSFEGYLMWDFNFQLPPR
jgi:hypothetical protein